MIDLSFLTLRNIALWLCAWSFIGFVIMGEDKDQAKNQKEAVRQERISEKTLYEVALAGGFAGIIMGAKVYDHKTSKLSFWPPVGASVLLWIVVLSILVRDGLVALTF